MNFSNHRKLTKYFRRLIYNDASNYILAAAAFFMGRVILFGTINPVVTAYISLFIPHNSFYVAAAAAALGLISVREKIFISRYIISIGVMAVLNIYAVAKRKNLRFVLGGISIAVGGTIYALINYISLYFFTLSILEGILSALLSFIFSFGMNVLTMKKTGTAVKNEEVLSLVTLLCLIITGSGNIYFGAASLSLYFVLIFLFLLAYKGGTVLTLGGAAVVCTLMVFTRTYTSEIFVVTACGCFMASIGAKAHKMLTPVGFLLGSLPPAFFYYRDLLTAPTLITVILSGITLFFVPDKLYLAFSGFADTNSLSHKYGEMIKEVASLKLTCMANSFDKLSRALTLPPQDTKTAGKDVAELVDEIASRVCNNCSMRQFCWDRNLYKTYQMVVNILSESSTKGFLDRQYIPKSFSESCYKIDEFYWTVSSVFELNRQSRILNGKIEQSRSLISVQLSGVSKLLKNLDKELKCNLVFDNEKSRILTSNLQDYGVNSAVVYKTIQNTYEVLITLKNCHNCNLCAKEIIPIVNLILDKKLRRYSYSCHIKNDLCSLRLVEEKKLSISAYAACAAKNGSVSGDSHTFMELDDGNYLMALSDGMGFGDKAREESAASIELFEDFMSAGFDKDMAINLINSTLLLKSNEDMFATLDICTVNLYTGMAEFIKVGAVSTYIIHKNRVEVIRSSTLPVGILRTVDTEISTTQLSREDIIIMTTDGVPDSFDNTLKRESRLKSIIEKCTYNKPKDIAEYILSAALDNVGENNRDDMTVLAAKVW